MDLPKRGCHLFEEGEPQDWCKTMKCKRGKGFCPVGMKAFRFVS